VRVFLARFSAAALLILGTLPLHAEARDKARDRSDGETAEITERSDISADAARVMEWISASRDNGHLPYIVIDKNAGMLFLHDAEGTALGHAPVLIGIAVGDEASPGVGGKKLAEIGPAEKTTPAGRFLSRYGRAVGNQRVLWVDYATSVALHAVVTGNRRERRQERLDSPTPEDNRITFGCINVPTEFYEETIRPLFQEDGGLVYVLPDTRPVEDVFPRMRLMPYL